MKKLIGFGLLLVILGSCGGKCILEEKVVYKKSTLRLRDEYVFVLSWIDKKSYVIERKVGKHTFSQYEEGDTIDINIVE